MSDQTVTYRGMHDVTAERPADSDHRHGIVLKWRRHGDAWEGLVTRETAAGITTEWLLALDLNPVAALPSRADEGADASPAAMPKRRLA